MRVARNREPGQKLKQIAADFGISESCLANWMKTADVKDGISPGTTAAENAELREACKTDQVARAGERGPASGGGQSVTGKPARRMIYPLFRELATDGIPVAVTCRVLKIARQPVLPMGGSIVNVLSILAKFQPVGSMPSSVFRAAGLALTNGTSNELAPMGIRVNGILIGYAHSDQWARAAADQNITVEEFEARTVRDFGIPMGRGGRGHTFLLSSRSSYLIGTCLNVDGGLSPVI